MRMAVSTNQVAKPAGPFSVAILDEAYLFASGQVAQDPMTGQLVAGDVTVQAEQVFRNINAVLRAAGKSLDHVVKATVYLTRMEDFKAMNEVYGRQFETPYPARTTVAVSALPLGAAIEIEVVAR